MDYNEYQGILRRAITSRYYPDSGLRFTPEANSVPEKIGYKAVADIGATTLAFWVRTTQEPYDIENQSNLLQVDFPILTTPGGNIKIANNASLTTIQAPSIKLPTFGSSITGSSLDFSGNALTADVVDELLNTLALSLSSGVSYETKIDLSGGTSAAPTNASSLARSSLYLAKTGYNITVATN